MQSINLKRFVDIDINKYAQSSVDSSRDTVLLFTDEGTAGTSNIVSSYTEAAELYADTLTLEYLKVYFENGGVKANVVNGIVWSALTNDVLNGYDDEYIVVAFVSESVDKEEHYAFIKNLAKVRQADSSVYGINEKILLASTSVITDSEVVSNFAVKYSSSESLDGVEMTIAAYLSKLDVYGADSIYDYAFTQEVINAEDISDADYGVVSNNNMNIDIILANAVRAVGGNCKDGADLVNTYVLIILHQTLTDRLISLLTQKIKNASGVSKMYSVIANELEKYKTSGYLTTDKIWSDDDLKISYNGTSYTIIENATALINGYVIKILPLSSLTDEDIANRKAPQVYVVLADQYGIRQITINGEVI